MVKQKKIPMRTCVVTKQKVPKMDLIRIVRTPEGEVKVDKTGKLNGRGVYLTKNEEVFTKAKRSKVLDRQLEIEIPDEIYEVLKNEVK